MIIGHSSQNDKEKPLFEKGWADLSSCPWSNNLYIELWHALNRIPEKDKQYLDYIIAHYGLIDDKPLSFEEIGARQTKPISKETARQKVLNIIKEVKKNEKNGFLIPRPFERIRALFKETVYKTYEFVKLSDWDRVSVLHDFMNNSFGFLKFLNDAGISHYKIGEETYLYSKDQNRSHIHQMIKRARREEIQKRKEIRLRSYKKIITYVPLEIKEIYQKMAGVNSVQKEYEKVLVSFLQKEPWKKYKGFFEDAKKTTYHGKYGDWVEVLIYVDRSLLDKVFALGKYIDLPPRVVICKALSWYLLENKIDG